MNLGTVTTTDITTHVIEGVPPFDDDMAVAAAVDASVFDGRGWVDATTGKPVFDAVRRRLGPISADQVYTMVPHFRLGGDGAARDFSIGGFIEYLKDIEFGRRNATESVALAQRLGLPFGDDEDWGIHIAIPLRGTEVHPLIARNVVRLHIRPNPDWQWELSGRIVERGEFSESEKKIYRNDLGLPVLGCGNLYAFPTWLRQVREKNGLDFDTRAADIRVGRKRAAAKLIVQWLES
ncbi:hypothetical protein [Rhizobium leguminosarum]|uniref:hypothetical protein n=1 Tax=Rhizobium leguminosarum TaxID=384 RepID=UPI000ABCC0CA|nr:hypothetical protein [Rhizobium leguminosarum]